MVNCEERRGAGFFSFFHFSPFAIHHTEVPPSQRGSTRLSPFKRGQILLFHSPFTIHHSQFRSASIPTRTLYRLSSPFLQATAVGSSEPAVASSVVALTGGLPGGAAGADPAVRDSDRTIRARCFSHHSRFFSIPSASRFIRRTK